MGDFVVRGVFTPFVQVQFSLRIGWQCSLKCSSNYYSDCWGKHNLPLLIIEIPKSGSANGENNPNLNKLPLEKMKMRIIICLERSNHQHASHRIIPIQVQWYAEWVCELKEISICWLVLGPAVLCDGVRERWGPDVPNSAGEKIRRNARPILHRRSDPRAHVPPPTRHHLSRPQTRQRSFSSFTLPFLLSSFSPSNSFSLRILLFSTNKFPFHLTFSLQFFVQNCHSPLWFVS